VARHRSRQDLDAESSRLQRTRPIRKANGLLFLSLDTALAIASTGWLKRRPWEWQLALVIVETQVLGDITNIFYGRIIQGVVGITIAGALLFYITRPFIRACFVTTPKQMAHSHDT
jgi:hypothetical protein